jgi:prepilin-type N-terminal cleavage/methylation domain-containing protein
VAIRPPNHNSQGYTLVEMLVVIIVTGIVMGIAVPSLMALNKPLRDATLQFKSQLTLIRAKAISSNQAYRLRPKYPTAAQYLGEHYNGNPHNFIVEYAANCQVTAPGGWQPASQLDLDLPESIGLDLPAVTATAMPVSPSIDGVNALPSLSWNVCYDNRGVATQSIRLMLQDTQGNNIAKYAQINVGIVGSSEIVTYNKDGSPVTPRGQNNPVF